MNLSIIGTGYVGLVTGTCFAEMGNYVICVDNNVTKLRKLKKGIVPIYEPGLDILFTRNLEKKRLTFTDDLQFAVLNSEIIFLCLPTPQSEDGSADLKHVREVTEKIGTILKKKGNKSLKIIVNKSTVPVGTSKELIKILQEKGLKNFDVVSNPEFLREGFAVEDFMKPDRIVLGAKSKEALEKMKLLYEPFVRQGNPILEMDHESAEVTKYAANSYLAMRITFMNELANFCEKVGANVDLVRKGLGSDTRIGKRFLFPGIGYGGSCFPKDVNALINTSKQYGSEMTILTQVSKVNERQKLILIEKLKAHFNNDIHNKKIAVWGLAFKPNTDDMREAASISVIKELLRNKITVAAYDPAAMENAKYYFNDSIEYSDEPYGALKNADALMILTEWNEFRNPDFEKIKSELKHKIIFDGRNIFDPDKMEELGFTYYSIGRRAVIQKKS
ncbi:UDP-glucose/GDP-mannose dehydrogenase family protein [Melioribacteraceae bacterium 4301-Me]|uniref:UDP-glucose dehydrogenase family protein n=1 Tax=Pyranulibacter aquaticus TaxID=3163344 RepID=UPI00359AA89D